MKSGLCIVPLVLTCILAGVEPADAARPNAHSDVEFLAVGKAANYRQHEERLVLLNYHFYAEIFYRADGHRVENALLVFPPETRRKERFADLGDMLKVKGGRYTSLNEMNADYPDGVYQFIFSTPDGKSHKRLFSIDGKDSPRPIPDPITIRLLQRGQIVSPEQVDPKFDLTIRWSPFSLGKSDPNGIIDDMIFVAVTDCHGERLAHSGKAFSEQGAYTFRNTEYVVDAGLLRPGWIYPMYVEHVVADTSREEQIPGMVANATTTFLDLKTIGKSEAKSCPRLLPQMEPGQTDRPAPGPE